MPQDQQVPHLLHWLKGAITEGKIEVIVPRPDPPVKKARKCGDCGQPLGDDSYCRFCRRWAEW